MRRLTTFLLSVSVSLSSYAPGYAQEVFEESRGLFVTRQLQDVVPIGSENKVIIRSVSTLQGIIHITASAEKEVAVSYVKKSKTDSRSKAIDFIDLIAVHLARSPQGVKLELRAPNPAPWADIETGQVEVELIVPENCIIEIDALYFDIAAEGPFEAVIVPASLGKLDICDVTKRLELETANRRVAIEEISGEISVITSNSPLTVKDISSAGRQAHFQNDGGDIEIDGFRGEFIVKNSYGRIKIADFEPGAGRSSIRGFSGPIVVEITQITDGQVVISNRFEDIEVRIPANLSARLSLAVEEGGKIEVGSIQFKTDLVQPNRLNLVAGDGEALISASVTGRGNIYLQAEEGD
jgi:hypothetical protein